MPAGKIDKKPKIFRKIHSFCFGVDKYEHISPLNGCINDVRAIHQILKANREDDSLHILIEEANRSDIFANLSLILKELKAGELLIIHASGHGTLYHQEFYYLPKEAHRDNLLGTGIPIFPLVKALSSHAQSGCKILLLFDTCNSGGVNFDIYTYMGEFKGGISCIFSSIAKENSFEIKINGESRGLFSYFIEQGFLGKAINYQKHRPNEQLENKKGHLKIIDLYDYTYDHVSNYPSSRPQYPLLIGTLEGDTIIHEVK